MQAGAGKKPPIGVLALQGSVDEHLVRLSRLGVQGVPVKRKEEIAAVDGMILPGGESTTIGRLLRDFGLLDPLKDHITNGLPVWGTCAGLILLARHILGETPYLGVMDITVRRNAYGRQIDSFKTSEIIPAFGQSPMPLVFIRAPYIESVSGGAEVLCELEGHIVAARQRNMLATAFHPELTENIDVYQYFLRMTEEARCQGFIWESTKKRTEFSVRFLLLLLFCVHNLKFLHLFLCHQLEQDLQLLWGKVVVFAAEITIDLNGLAVIDHFLKVFFADTDEGLGDTFSGTVTFELGRQTVNDIYAEIAQYNFQDLFGSLAFFQE